MTNVSAAGRAAEARLAPLLAEAYRVFASPTPPLPLLVCSCDVCFTPDAQAAFVRFALPEIPTGYLLAYLTSVPLEVPGDDDATRRGVVQRAHFLPRVLTGLVRGEELSHLVEVTLEKFDFACPGAYSPAQLAFLRRFATGWAADLCTHPHPSSRGYPALPVLLEMWQRAGLDVTAAVCEVWAGHAAAVPAIRNYLAILETTNPTTPAPEPQWRFLEQWVYRPAVRAAFTAGLEAALLAGSEEEDETQQWEAWYTYLSGL
ncbi:hypothetical protein [Buchananella hordeovulneris]|uniref:hypothetical protein n=1 Tax=Buchananella hordeovulneris TaxID=52770 RepID=UPI000F5FFF19|nr:hypothetical protein [Buchananella hordeovulneris]RRD43276.1 hypothetical protein EII13_07200 [Buchananella hordeovulneris]